MLAYIYGRWGKETQARRALARVKQIAGERKMDLAPLLVAYIGVGDKEQALAVLQQAYAERSSALTALNVDPMYDPLRGDPRFQDVVRRVVLSR